MLVLVALLLSGCAPFMPVNTGPDDDVRPVEKSDEPAGLFYQLLVADLAAAQGDARQSLDAYMKAMRLTDDPRVAARAAQIALQTGDPAGYEAAQRWLSLAPEDPDALLALAMFELRRGERPAALKALRTLLREGRGDLEHTFARIAAALSREQDEDAAVAVLQTLADDYPAEPYGYYALGLMGAQLRREDLALRTVDRALAVTPGWPPAVLLKARIHLQAGDSAEAVRLLESVVARRPDDYELRLHYARALLGATQLHDALSQFEELLRNQPDDPRVLYSAALLAMELERPEQARNYLLKLVNLGQRLNDAYYYLAQLAEQEGDYKGAMRWYAEVEGDWYPDAQVRMAVLSAARGELAAARQRLARLRKNHPDQAVEVYVTEAEILRRAGKEAEARQLLETALQAHPADPDLLYARAMAAAETGDIASAERDLREILERQPDHAHALNALGYTLIDSTARVAEGFALIRRAYKVEPNNPAIMDSMGWAYFRSGDPASAVPHLEEAYELSPDPVIAAHLVEVLWRLGEFDQARIILDAALERDPESDLLKSIRKRLIK